MCVCLCVSVCGVCDGGASSWVALSSAQCLVIAEMTTDRLLMVLNKTDMLPADNRAAHVKKAEEGVRRGLKGTKFAEAPMVAVAACPGAEEGAPPLGISQLVRSRVCVVCGVWCVCGTSS